MNNEVTASRQSEVSIQLGELDNSVDRLEEAVASLHSRLSSVLKNVPSDKSAIAPDEELVQLAHAIRSPRQRMDNCIHELKSIISDIEL